MRSSSPRDIRRLPSANRPSISQASAIITAPVVVIVSDTVWMRDGRLSSRTPNVGSWTTGWAPAPSAPIAINTVPVAPNRRVRTKRGELGVVQRRNPPPVRRRASWRSTSSACGGGCHHSSELLLPGAARRVRCDRRNTLTGVAWLDPPPELRHTGVVKFRAARRGCRAAAAASDPRRPDPQRRCAAAAGVRVYHGWADR